MSETTAEDNFEFERLLKILLPFINDDNTKILQQWNSCNEACQASWALFNALPTTDNRIEAKIKADELFAMEDAVNDAISIIFLETPDPNTIKDNWDAGQEQAEIHEREQTIIGIKKLISECYSELRTQLKVIVETKEDSSILEQSKISNDTNNNICNQNTKAESNINTSDPSPETNQLNDHQTKKLNGTKPSNHSIDNENSTLTIKDFDDIFDNDLI